MPAPRSIGRFHLDALIATWFGVGLFPYAPGTIGSLAALPFAWLISTYLGPLGLAVGVIVVYLAGIWASGRYAKRRGIADPGPVVVDEVAGQWLALILVPPGFITLAIGFAFFRLFDVIKPWPISAIDRRVKGGLGVMSDDLLAGALAAILTWNVWIWIPP
ncbi:MAG: phosphatidylglycerophosphatase A [Alphaproteobacteria bacterium]|nr:phosphatidylglycerophosphatase A [Alphaproteobacteria bacterium]